MEEVKGNVAKFDAMTALFVVYLLYKGNQLTNHRLKDLLKVIKETPEGFDFVKYIAEEANKA